MTPPEVHKQVINRKRPLKWWDRRNLEAAQELILRYDQVIAVYIPNKLVVTEYATPEEDAALKDFYDPAKARSMPHHPLRDQERIRKELQLKNVKRHGQMPNDEL